MSTSKVRTSKTAMPGMRPFPREKTVQIEEMKADELRTLYRRNEEVLRTLIASSSMFVAKIEANQEKIRKRLAELEGLDNIQRGMRRTTLGEDALMAVDSEPEDQTLNAVKVKQQAIADWDKSSKLNSRYKTARMSVQEAIILEQQHNAEEKARRERAEARRQKLTLPKPNLGPGMAQSREDYEAKVWAFMNYKPTESDMEDYDEDEDEDEDEDPASWFHDDEDDGIKGQDIVYPDTEDLADVIRMDESKFPYNTFYEPRDSDE